MTDVHVESHNDDVYKVSTNEGERGDERKPKTRIMNAHKTSQILLIYVQSFICSFIHLFICLFIYKRIKRMHFGVLDFI